MKIGIEVQRLFRQKKSGMDLVALNLINQLKKMNLSHQFYIFCADGPDKTCVDFGSNFELIIVRGSNYAVWEQFFLPIAIAKIKLDLIHFTSNTASLFGVKCPIIVTIHDIIYLERSFVQKVKGSNYQVLGNFYRSLIVPSITKKANYIITVSDFEKKKIMARFPKVEGKIVAVHNGIDADRHKLFREEYSGYVKSNLPQNYFFHFGNTEPRKNTEGVIISFCKFKSKVGSECFLVLSGVSSNFLNKMLIKHSLQSLESSIFLVGYIEEQHIPAILANSKALLFPSFKEGFGLPTIEAMTNGCPVITSKIPPLREVCHDAAFYVDPTSTEEIAHSMEVFFNDENIRIKYANKGLLRAQTFSWAIMAETVNRLYLKLRHSDSISQ